MPRRSGPRSGRPSSAAGAAVAMALAVLARSAGAQGVLFEGELNMVGLYSTAGGAFGWGPMAPRSSLGLEWGHKAPSGREAGDRLAFESADVHLRLVVDPIDDAVRPLPYDAWARFGLGEKRRLRLGHFQVPFGLNPVVASRSMFLLPLAAYDLGFKWDWGLAYEGWVGRHRLDVAATAGVGERLDLPDGGFLVAGRIGTPTFRDREVGLSLLLGRLAGMVGNHLTDPEEKTRFRVGADMTVMRRPYRVVAVELALGSDDGTPVGGAMVSLDHILPFSPAWSVEAQLASWRTDLGRGGSDNTLLTLAVVRAIPTAHALVRLAWVHNLHIAMGQPFLGEGGDDRLFLQLHWTFDLPRLARSLP